ncbi:MAG: LysM peptidoglycan-binding domain-containing protein [Deltaproteobacteria bacterium]|jgi:LysM domain-containing protein|nr:LysM peptidoglycan-binding domain-containing protein [Deltaproteobacteria bacterium]
MTSETVCPVCGLSSIPSDRAQCPQCDADLTCFMVLDSLYDEPVRKNIGSRKQVILLVAASLVLGLICVMSAYQLYLLKQLENRILDRKTSFIDAGPDAGLKRFVIDQSRPHTNGAPENKAVIETKEDIKELSVPVKPLEKTDIGAGLAEDSKFWTYGATEKDTLWDISKKYYGSGAYYPVLLEHNSHLEIYDIGDRIQIKILKDTAMARDIYKKITKKKGNSIYWYYTVAEGDTIQSIAGKFYKTKNMIKLITDSNPEVDLKSGEKIRILLK